MLVLPFDLFRLTVALVLPDKCHVEVSSHGVCIS